MKFRFKTAAFALIAVFALPTVVAAQPVLLPSASLAGDDPDGTLTIFGDAYGVAATTWEDWLFVGAPRETAMRGGVEEQDGAVYAYRKVGGAWIFQQKLTIPGSAIQFGDRFGGGIEAAGGWLMVGAANDQDFPGLVDPRAGIDFPDPFTFAGQVQVFRYNGSSWDFVQTLKAPEPKSSGSFGTRTQASHIAINSKGKVAVIGELNNFEGDDEIGSGVGKLHTYRLKKGSWQYVQALDAPAGIDSFGDDLVFVNDKYLVAGGIDFSDDGLTAAGYVFVYESKGNSGKFFAVPKQTIAGPVTNIADCPIVGTNSFGAAGLDAGGGVVAVGDGCASGAAGAFTGAVSIYRLSGGPVPLAFEQTIEGDEPDLFMGANTFGARHAVAVSESGGRILAGAPLSSDISIFDDGADVRVFAFDGASWGEESNLTSSTPATGDFRSFGDAVFFLDNEAALIREGNFLSPFITGLKSQGLIYDLTP
jgi:hypothetical protein